MNEETRPMDYLTLEVEKDGHKLADHILQHFETYEHPEIERATRFLKTFLDYPHFLSQEEIEKQARQLEQRVKKLDGTMEGVVLGAARMAYTTALTLHKFAADWRTRDEDAEVLRSMVESTRARYPELAHEDAARIALDEFHNWKLASIRQERGAVE